MLDKRENSHGNTVVRVVQARDYTGSERGAASTESSPAGQVSSRMTGWAIMKKANGSISLRMLDPRDDC